MCVLESQKRTGGGEGSSIFGGRRGRERERASSWQRWGEMQRMMMMRGKEYTRCRRACGPQQDMNEKKGEGRMMIVMMILIAVRKGRQ